MHYTSPFLLFSLLSPVSNFTPSYNLYITYYSTVPYLEDLALSFLEFLLLCTHTLYIP